MAETVAILEWLDAVNNVFIIYFLHQTGVAIVKNSDSQTLIWHKPSIGRLAIFCAGQLLQM